MPSDLEGVRSRNTPGTCRASRLFVESRQGEVAPEVLLGLGIGTEDDIANRKSHHELHHEDGTSMITIMTSSRASWSSLVRSPTRGLR
jgi:hypothetical protein